MSEFGTVIAGIASFGIASEVGNVFVQSAQAKAAQRALDVQAKENQINYNQQSVANYDKILTYIDRQKAVQAASGTASNSPSFGAIQQETFRKGAKAQQNLNLSKSLADRNIDVEKQNVRDKFIGDIFGDVSRTVDKGVSIFESGLAGGAGGLFGK